MLKAPDYLHDGATIYERSFAIIRAEADLSRFTPEEAEIAVRMIHACGQVDVARAIEFAPGLVEAARAALKRGAPIFCDAAMVAQGITRARLDLTFEHHRLGNAPTALFRLLEMLEAGALRPAAILGIPVGFVGAAESKAALAANSFGVPYLIVRGRMGGSAMTAAAVNALAKEGL